MVEYYTIVRVYTHITFSVSIPPLIDLVLCCIIQLHRHDSVTKHSTCIVGSMCYVLCPTLCDPIRLLCLWNSLGKNTGVGCRFLPQGIFPTQGSNPSVFCLLSWQVDSLSLALPGKCWWLSESSLFSLGLSRKIGRAHV